MRWTIAVDFDGVIHRYETPWINPHTIPDPPVDGAIEWLHRMVQDFAVVIYSTRCRTWRGRRAVRAWLKKHAGQLWWEGWGHLGLEEVKLSYEKPPALIYLDDRAVRFEGPQTFEALDAARVHRLRPWHK